MKNVAIVIHNYLAGGAERITERLIAALKPHGYRFTLFTNKIAPDAEPRAREVFDDIRVYSKPISGFGESASRAIAAEIAPLRPDIIWLVGDDYERLDLMRDALAPGGKIIFHLHSIPFFQVKLKTASAFKKFRERLFHTYTKRYKTRTANTLRNVDYYITLCEGYAEQLRALYPADAVKIRAIYNPAPEQKGVAAPTGDERKNIVYIGRLSRDDKRVDNLLRIFARVAPSHPDWTLKIIGDGPARPALEELARKLDFHQIKFLGYQPKFDLSDSSIICLTSVIEGWGMALIEGMQQGLAPIAFNCSAGVSELLADGRGILIEPGKIDEYAGKLAELMDSPTLREQICAAHPAFLRSLDINTITNSWICTLKN